MARADENVITKLFHGKTDIMLRIVRTSNADWAKEIFKLMPDELLRRLAECGGSDYNGEDDVEPLWEQVLLDADDPRTLSGYAFFVVGRKEGHAPWRYNYVTSSMVDAKLYVEMESTKIEGDIATLTKDGKQRWAQQFGTLWTVPNEIVSLVIAGLLDDTSWHNDTTPRFEFKNEPIVLCVDHITPSQREFPDEPRYTIYVKDSGEDGVVNLYHGDDLNVVLMMLKHIHDANTKKT